MTDSRALMLRLRGAIEGRYCLWYSAMKPAVASNTIWRPAKTPCFRALQRDKGLPGAERKLVDSGALAKHFVGQPMLGANPGRQSWVCPSGAEYQ
jgi:hypothetical protein